MSTHNLRASRGFNGKIDKAQQVERAQQDHSTLTDNFLQGLQGPLECWKELFISLIYNLSKSKYNFYCKWKWWEH